MYILGISAFYHDSAACLVKDGQIVAAVQEERFTRRKHDQSFPLSSIRYCLNEAKIGSEDLSFVVFYDKPFIKLERILYTYLAYAPKGIKSFMKSVPLWIKQKLWIKALIEKELKDKAKIIFIKHHQSHAASAFFPSPFKKSALLTIDGVGEWDTATYGLGEGNKIKILAKVKFPHSLGLLYSAFTYYLGFKVNSGEYKLMGLASYGKPVYKDLIFSELVDLKKDGSFRLNLKYFNYCAGTTMINRKFEKLFGRARRKPDLEITQKHMDLASSLQEVTEEVILRMAVYLRKKVDSDTLCFSGGVALNCVVNGKLLKQSGFKNIWVQPAASDAGGALGAALFAWYQYLENKRSADGKHDYQKGSLLGPAYPNWQIRKTLEKSNLFFKELKNQELFEKTAELIAAENVIGWFQARMEFGPRALGSRSILADARNIRMQDIINSKVKFREKFRPFAPSVLEEHKDKYFDLDRPSPYMLLAVKVIRTGIPAVTHADYSARVQTVNNKDNFLYYGLIKAFYRKYGCPVILNTSFNIGGKPIVAAPREAVDCFLKTGLDCLVIGNFLILKKDR